MTTEQKNWKRHCWNLLKENAKSHLRKKSIEVIPQMADKLIELWTEV